jgi:cytochrome c oxidase subunit 1
LRSKRLARWQLWLWFWGMMITSIPWHITGLMGQPRRVAIFDFSDPLLAPMVPLAILSVIGGFILLLAAILFIVILIRSQVGEGVVPAPLRYALAVNPPVRVPKALNGFALWNTILLMFMIVEYGYPIGQFFILKSKVPVVMASVMAAVMAVTMVISLQIRRPENVCFRAAVGGKADCLPQGSRREASRPIEVWSVPPR